MKEYLQKAGEQLQEASKWFRELSTLTQIMAVVALVILAVLGLFVGIPLAIIALLAAAVYWFKAFGVKEDEAEVIRAQMIKSFTCGVAAMLFIGLSILGYILL